MADAYIYDAVRTPRGKGRKDGALHEVTAVRLSAQVLNALKDRNGLDGHAVEDVIWGNVTQVMEQGGCLARTAVLASDRLWVNPDCGLKTRTFEEVTLSLRNMVAAARLLREEMSKE